jgi:heptosyltransferase-2
MEVPEKPRILVVQTAFLGDVVLVTPLLSAIRTHLPESFLAFMGTPGGAGLLRGLPGVDEFIVYDKRGKERGLKGFLEKARELGSYKFDLAISAHRSVRTAALLALAGVKNRIGFATSSVPWLYHARAPRDPGKHEVLRNLALMEPLGGPPQDFEPKIELTQPDPTPDGMLSDDGSGPRVGVCPGSVWPTKRWRAEGFAQVADRLREEAGAAVYLIGSEDDLEAAAAVEGASRRGVVNLAGRTGLREWVSLISAMDLVITNDSSPTHIASALCVPVVAVFGPTTSLQGFAPWGNHNRVVERSDLACRPCGEHGSRRCPEGHFKCMQRIRPDEVFFAALSLLGEGD